jgi:6,7-dimethyl-8-ribityllumazine synthase
MAAAKQKSNLTKTAAQGKRFAIVAARYNEEITKDLVSGATSTLESLGAKGTDITVIWVPGSFEIPFAAHAIAQHHQVDAILCLGVIIKGETRHDEVIAAEVARGIAAVGHAGNLPVVFGVLTTGTLEQARARSGGAKGHKGIEAAETAVEMIQIFEQIKAGAKRPSGGVGFGMSQR